VLVAFNPAAAKANVGDLRPGAMLIINSDAFNKKSYQRAGYTEDPLPELRERFELVEIPVTTLNREALIGLDLTKSEIDRSKNFFALGLMSWLYTRPMESTERWLSTKFSGDVCEANLRTLRAGWAFGETTELFPVSYKVSAAKIEPGIYRNITGNTALAWGIIAARVLMDREVFLGAYPITPASDVLHEVARHRNVRRQSRRDRKQWPRHRVETRSAGLGHHGRASVGSDRRTTLGTVDGLTDQDRAGRLAPRPFRPPLREPHAGTRAFERGGLLRHNDRSVPARGEVHDAGHGLVRQLPSQQF
jgi:hypothetical protein